MTTPQLGTLTVAPLREAWPHEALNFTPWLAENLNGLAEVIGIPLELVGKEIAVGGFSADILARNPQDDSVVLIENQLEGTDHSHLGQIMTYLAGLKAQTIIWIAAGFNEAHLSAIHWLNEHTEAPFSFFAVRVKVVRIGDSPMAPIFEVLARPSGWDRLIHTVTEDPNWSEIGQFRLKFWTRFVERHPDVLADEPAGGVSNRWRTVPPLDIVVSYYVAKHEVGIFVRGRRGVPGGEVFATLEPYAQKLEELTGAKFGTPKGNYFLGRSYRADTSDQSRWDELGDWLHEQLTIYTAALQEIGEDVAPETA